ncbi:Transcriptional corepressor LEUNIG-like protein [Quillaja saponaria]|uniref:Transcriptional corepressor LEUNIG-like protein n=1 Tax=Quillaja saponaria TaxID=32244 RepID=A0AAD7PVB1_QUISA|nr:Transcriptional corepressor LEUNIG-like protein [Quillaja saponaria]
MASGENWDPDQILQLYLHDYMVKRRMNKAAAIFKEEANVGDNPIVIDSPEGFLYEWWSIFYEIYASRNQETRAEAPAKNQVLSSLFQGPNHQHQFQVMNPQSQKSLFTDVPACVPGARTSILLPSSTNRSSLLLKTPKSEPSDKNGQVMVHVVQTAEHQYQFDRLQQHQFLEIENSRKRKATISPRDGQSTLDGANAAEDRPVGENVESYLSNDNENADNMTVPFSNLKRRSAAFSVNGSKGFAFEEVSCLHSSKGKVLCCHFSSNGKLLASAGHEKKVTIWNMETFDFVTTSEDHSLLITDVRFRPSSTVFATSSFDRTVNIWDSARGHVKDVLSICWDLSGKYIASVSEDSIRLWSAVSGGKCIHELHSNGNRFQSCTFHPGYSDLLIIGGYQSLELWNPTDGSKTLSIPAHKGLITGLSDSQETEMVASASHDQCVKLWK